MKLFEAPLMLIILVLFASCSGLPSPESPVRNETATALAPSPTTIAAPTVTVTRPATSTPVPPSPTPAITSTPTIPPEARLKIQCLDVLPTLPSQANSQGIVILSSYTSPDVFLLNMVTGAKTQLAKQNEDLKYFAVSPDRERVAYERGLLDPSGHVDVAGQLVIATADGHIQKAIPWEKAWVRLPGWLDDKRLIINIAGNDPDEDAAKKPATLLMVNPFTGDRRVLPPDFPEISYQYPVLYWEGWSETVYDPTLTRVVYPGPGYVLWDLEAQRALATLRSRFLHPPHWSLDGAQFVVAADPDFGEYSFGYELFSISQDGQSIIQLTSLKAFYPAADMWGYSWSPQGNRLAFWLSTDPNAVDGNDHASQRLAVLDLASQEVTDYCIPLDAYGGDSTIPFFASGVTSPIWSPDGQQLVVESRYDKDASRVILVDLAKGFAAQIADTMMPAGWMKSEP